MKTYRNNGGSLFFTGGRLIFGRLPGEVFDPLSTLDWLESWRKAKGVALLVCGNSIIFKFCFRAENSVAYQFFNWLSKQFTKCIEISKIL